MPVFFASNAIYPIEIMPAWLRTISSLNPLTYEVDGLRALMLAGGTSKYGIALDLAVLATVFLALVGIAARLYPRLTE
jgi:ABC-2 type transport system permease protein